MPKLNWPSFFLIGLTLASCRTDYEAVLDATTPTVISTKEAIVPLFRRMARLSRNCNDGSWIAGSYVTETEFYDREGFGEIIFQAIGWYGSGPVLKTVITDKGSRREVAIFGKGFEANLMADWAQGKTTCR